MDFTELGPVLVWIVAGGGSGLIAYWLWGRLETWFTKVEALNKELKRYLSLALTAAISVGAFGIQLAMQYATVPASPEQWVEQIFSIVALAVVTALSIHGRKQLSKQAR